MTPQESASEPKALKQVQTDFTDRTQGNALVEILAYHQGQTYPIFVQYRVEGENNQWILATMSEEGEYSIGSPTHALNLVKRRPPLPVNTLCDVWQTDSGVRALRYSDGVGGFYDNGATAATSLASRTWDNFEVVKDESKPWTDGTESPIPDGCEYQIYVGSGWFHSSTLLRAVEWDNERRDSQFAITAFQILGEKK